MQLDTIVCGDCLDVMAEMPDGCVDLVVTDPPYGKQFHDGGLAQRSNEKWKRPSKAPFKGVKIIGDSRPDTRVCAELYRVMKDTGAVYLFSQWMVEREWIKSLRNTGFKIRNRLVWVKPFHGAGDLQTTYGPQHETIIFAAKGRHELQGKRLGDVWLEPVGSNGCFRKGKSHPNEKPISLVQLLIEKSSNSGEIVIDPFIGSGTTAVAALKLGRHFFGCDISPEYVALANERIEKTRLELSQMTFALQPGGHGWNLAC